MIVGYPQTGKTKMSAFFDDRQVIHTDHFIGMEDEIVDCIYADRFCIEGVHGFRMLRSGFEVDAVVYIKPKFEAMPKHRAQRKACDTIWNQYLQKADAEIFILDEDALRMILELERNVLIGVEREF